MPALAFCRSDVSAAVTYERDEALLNVDLRVVRTSPALVPTADVQMKSSRALSTSYKFAKDRPLHGYGGSYTNARTCSHFGSSPNDAGLRSIARVR